MGKTLFDKVWERHIVKDIEEGPSVLYIDRHFIHEVTSPVAFQNMECRGNTVARPDLTTATPDHNVPTMGQDKPIQEEMSRMQVERLIENCRKYKIECHHLGTENHGIVHIIGPELGLTQPGSTIVCGDSHTATHGAFGAIAFGIGTSEVEMVLTSQCLLQPKPKQMRINIEGKLREGVSAKDLILYVISRIGTAGGTGYFVEFAGSTVRSLSMEGRMTVCNMAIEMGSRGGMIAPDQKTLDYLQNRPFTPKEVNQKGLEVWADLCSDEDAPFDKEYHFNAEDIESMITYGTNPGMGITVTGTIPTEAEIAPNELPSFQKSLEYMGFHAGEKLLGKKIDYVFVGSCTNGRIEDFREFAAIVKGKKKAAGVTVWLVPGSQEVERQIRDEGLDKVIEEAGFSLRQPGCSACLAMNDDKIPEGKYAVSTSNRNFEGRQGPGARTLLAAPRLAAFAAINGVISKDYH